MHIKEIQNKQQKMLNKIAITRSQHTYKKYQIAFKNFNTYLETNHITTINTDNVDDLLIEYLATLTGNKKETINILSPNTSIQYMILIKKFLTKECKLTITIEKDDLPKVEKIKPKYIKLEQYHEIQQYLDQQLKHTTTKHKEKNIQMDKILITLLFNTGLRIHEALKIKIKELTDAIKDKNNIYQLDIIGKGTKERTIFISSSLYTALIQYIQDYTMPTYTYIFESNKNPNIPITTRTIERHFKNIAKELDAINGTDADDKNSYQTLFKPHHLRHSFAVIKMDKGIKINELQGLLGHSNITTTQIYTDLNNESLSNAIAKTL